MAAAAGVELVLAEPVLDEVVGHLRATDQEYQDNWQGLEPFVDLTVASSADKILVRSYFYARLHRDPTAAVRPMSWGDYLNQFVNPGRLHEEAAFTDVQVLLQKLFAMTFMSRQELRRVADSSRVRPPGGQVARDWVAEPCRE